MSDAESEAFLKRAAGGSPGEAAARQGSGRPRSPRGRRTGPARQESGGGRVRRRRRRLLGVIGALVTVAVAVVAVRPSLLLYRFGGDEGSRGPGLSRRAEPFRGPPALSWADGAEGSLRGSGRRG
ncbi:hypothetical protein [Streptomyces griseoviridis]|uniref:Uncharacterized protein n=1 Tax=Streptomyces griseoviridis TaxID=45398 RepID=A0ABT9LIH8_STRGD|nr:hypothetical protein [Streptomyces griseoviridis]MDP9683522.1 hypothetical protein [Streptomyces griseoviridis]